MAGEPSRLCRAATAPAEAQDRRATALGSVRSDRARLGLASDRASKGAERDGSGVFGALVGFAGRGRALLS